MASRSGICKIDCGILEKVTKIFRIGRNIKAIRIFLYIFVLLVVLSNGAFAESNNSDDDDGRYELFYKNGKAGGSLEKVDLAPGLLSSLFSVDLRKDENFAKAIDNSILFYSKVLDSGITFRYGEDEYTPMEMINSLLMFKELMQKDCDYVTFLNELNEKFNIYEAKNRSDKAVLTGYFTPHIDALPKKSKGFRVPVIIKDSDESRSNYFVHSGRDVYDLKMEGAGVVQLPDGKNMTIEYAGKKRLGTIKKIVKRVKKRVRVASKNGHKSTKIVYVKKIIKVAKQAPYFRVTEGGPYGWADVPLIPKYTAAIDRDLAPMGGLMYIKSTQNLESVDTVFDTHPSFSQFEGFMLAQDVGSAIKGGGRVDVYCGEGDEARYGANSITRIGMVYLLVAKKDKLDINIDRRADLHE